MTKTADFGRCTLLLSETDCMLECKAEHCEGCLNLLLAKGKQLQIMSIKYALNASVLLAADEDIQFDTPSTALVSFIGMTAILLLREFVPSSTFHVTAKRL